MEQSTEQTHLTEVLRIARGLVAGFDPTAGPERTRAFLSDLTALFTDVTEPIGFQQYATSFEEIGRIVDRYRNGNLTSAEALDAIHEQVGDAPAPAVVEGTDFSEQMTSVEVAKAFGVAPGTVSKWAKDGRVASIRTPGGHHRYSRAEIEALLRGESR